MIRAVPDAIDLDHLAVAAERLGDLWPRYLDELGGRWVGGGPSPGFDWAQVSYANGMRVEGLEPARTDEFDFLRRFLDRLGAGPHHITFKVPDLDDVLARLAARDIEPARVDRSEPDWQEAFLFPADAGGIVVQLAQAGDDEPDDFGGGPPPSTAAPAWLDHLALAVADPGATRTLFEGVLGGSPVADGSDGEGPWIELAWPGPGRLRLVAAEGAAKAWIGERAGRLHHVAFTVDDPARIAGAVERDGGSFEVPPESNLGVRLRLSPAA